MPGELGNFRRPEERRWRFAETTSQTAALPGSLAYKIIRGRLSAVDIGNWLRGLGLAQYEPAFRDNDVDAEVLLRLTADDLRELGVTSIGHRRRLLDAIAALTEGAPKPAAPLPNPPPRAGEGRVGAEAERRQLTVMFCDLAGSTALSARL